jgi:hypothetical protein
MLFRIEKKRIQPPRQSRGTFILLLVGCELRLSND